jgi:hypothetical protein
MAPVDEGRLFTADPATISSAVPAPDKCRTTWM